MTDPFRNLRYRQFTGLVTVLLLCTACPATEQERPQLDGGSTLLCNDNEHVTAGRCQPCALGTGRQAGDDPKAGDTNCEPIRCAQDEAVMEHRCVPCAPGSQRTGGDDASGLDTACLAIQCPSHERVEAHRCVPCEPGSTNEAGDDATGADSQCSLCPEGTFDPGTHQCEDCPPGSISEPGATGCSPCEGGTFAHENRCEPCPETMTSETGAESCVVELIQSRLDTLDYGYTYWPGNHWYRWNNYEEIRHIQTGYYGLAFDVSEASLIHMGLMDDSGPAEATLLRSNEAIQSLGRSAVRYGLRVAGQDHLATGFWGRERSASNPSELIDMGRYMQRIEIPEVTYENTEMMEGSIQLAAMPKHFVLSHRVRSDLGGIDLALRIEIGGEALSGFSEIQWLDEGRALSLGDGEGRGWIFLVAADGAHRLEYSAEEGLVAERYYPVAEHDGLHSISLTAIPAAAATSNQLDVWLRPRTTVRVESSQLQRDGNEVSPLTQAVWDQERGVFLLPIEDLTRAGAPRGRPYGDPDFHNWYNRHKVVLINETDGLVSIPLAMDGGGNAAVYITGGSPLWRDQQGEPIGVPIQISKNWHDPPAWYHLYSQLTLPPGRHEFELTFAHSKWGEAYAAAHAQLSLVGWGRNQQWDQSSLGTFGESITYDPDLTLGRSMVDDVRPFLVDANGRWNWTGNVGGANFLVYAHPDSDNRPEHQLGRLRTDYAGTGPNLTDVSYGGITRDGKIEARITTQLGRTDDLVRVYYHLDYRFLEEVSYDRLALFQMGADRYGDNGFSRYAYGDEETVHFDEAVPDHGTTGYASEADRGIPLSGRSPWVMLYANTWQEGNLPEHLANVGFVVRDYRAQLGGEVHTTPHINIIRTNNRSSQMAFELGLPEGAEGRVVPAGSHVTATVEYLVPPADKARYYGEADYLTQMLPASFENTDLMQRLAADNRLELVVVRGEARRVQPVEIEATAGAVATQFRLNGGLGYVPVTIEGLARPDGWRLEQRVGGDWQRVDQSVEGNDYWQALDRGTDGFALVFNLHNRGRQEYRLTRSFD
ncbi:MAG: hypothetical protein VX405_09290 [Myxococcota bacterium]|nr:hypothetical protein [Myxococcota bacterium]